MSKIEIPGYDVPIQIGESINPTWYEKLKVLADASGGASAGIIPRNVQNADYACVLTDAGKFIYNSTGNHTYLIQANSIVPFEIGTTITFVNVAAGGVVAIACSDTLILMGPGTVGNRTLASYGMATVLKIHDTGWVISGVGLT